MKAIIARGLFAFIFDAIRYSDLTKKFSHPKKLLELRAMLDMTAATIATSILTKVFEKNGEKITDLAWQVAGKLLNALKKKNPLIAMKLENVQQNPDLLESYPDDFSIEILSGEIASLMENDSIRLLVEELISYLQTDQPNHQRMIVVSNTKVEENLDVQGIIQISTSQTSEQSILENVTAKSITIKQVEQRN
jgi:hypothetical protein